MKKKLLTIVSALMLVLSGTLFFGKQNLTEAYSTVGEAQGFQYETGKYQLDAAQPFGGSDWNRNSSYLASTGQTQELFSFGDSEDMEFIYYSDILIDKNGDLFVKKFKMSSWPGDCNDFAGGRLIKMSKKGEILWENYYTDRFNPVMTESGNIIVTDRNEIRELDGRNGSVLWKLKGEEGRYFTGTVSIDKDGLIYCYNEIGKIYILNPNGTLKEKSQYIPSTQSIFHNYMSGYRYTHGREIMISSTGEIFLLTDYNLTSINKNGEILWTKELSEYSLTFNSKYDQYYSFAFDNDGEILLSGHGRLIKISSTDGSQIKNVVFSNDINLQYKPVIDKKSGNVYLSCSDMFYAFDKNLNLIKKFEYLTAVTEYFSDPIIDKEGNVILATTSSLDIYNKDLIKISSSPNDLNYDLNGSIAIDKNGVIYGMGNLYDLKDELGISDARSTLIKVGEPTPQSPSCSGLGKKSKKPLIIKQ